MNTRERLQKRETLETILESKASLDRIQYIREIISSLSSVICIINHKNQIVFTNDVMIDNYGLNLEENILGKRPGEFLNCENAINDTGGCGTTEKCEYCGAFNALDLAWKEKRKVTQECKISTRKDNITQQLDLEITATPLVFDTDYLIISIADISEKKQKELLERIFFHDILNIAGSLSGILQLYPMFNDEEKQEYLPIMSSLTDEIIDEIKAQRQMIQAEMGELTIEPENVTVDSLLLSVSDKIRFHQISIDKNIDLNNGTPSSIIYTDEVLLTRILINMAKNALEAININETILIYSEFVGDQIRLGVHNQSFIPKSTQLQIFKRSFSTKGKSRGLGTYSMKLLGEKFLKGKVNFKSNVDEGTFFFVDLPLKK